MINNNVAVSTKSLSEIANELKLLRLTIEDAVAVLSAQTITVQSDDIESKDAKYIQESGVDLTRITELTRNNDIPARVGNALVRSRIRVLGDLKYVNRPELMRIWNLGEKSVNWLMSYCEENNIPIGTRGGADTIAKAGDIIEYGGYSSDPKHTKLKVIRVNYSTTDSYYRFTEYECTSDFISERPIYASIKYVSPGQILKVYAK